MALGVVNNSNISCLPKCGSTEVTFKYKLTFFATDGTAEAQMFCFDEVAKRIVGKPCDILLTSMTDTGKIPPDLAAIVALKFTFAVKININSYDNADMIFTVTSVLQTHGRQPTLPRNIKDTICEEPSTPDKIRATTSIQDSPATAMQRLSTTTMSLTPKSLMYSPAGSPSKHHEACDAEDSLEEIKLVGEQNIRTHVMQTATSKTLQTDLGSPPKKSKTQSSKQATKKELTSRLNSQLL